MTRVARPEGTKGSLKWTQRLINDGPNQWIDWEGTFYQYTNRLAHLYLLRELNGLDAYLVFLYFVNALQMNGSQSIREWQAATKVLKAPIGVGKHPFLRYVINVFIDVSGLKDNQAEWIC